MEDYPKMDLGGDGDVTGILDESVQLTHMPPCRGD